MIHPTAEISEKARIGNNTSLWQHVHVREGAVIGNNCTVGKGVYIDKKVIIGNNCKIQNNSLLYHGTTLQDEVFIGPQCILTNDKFPRATNKRGELKGEQEWVEGKILVKKGASIGAGSCILPNVTIGEYALIGANSLVTKDIPNHGLVFGSPAKLRGYVCKCGNKVAAPCKSCPNCSRQDPILPH